MGVFIPVMIGIATAISVASFIVQMVTMGGNSQGGDLVVTISNLKELERDNINLKHKGRYHRHLRNNFKVVVCTTTGEYPNKQLCVDPGHTDNLEVVTDGRHYKDIWIHASGLQVIGAIGIYSSARTIHAKPYNLQISGKILKICFGVDPKHALKSAMNEKGRIEDQYYTMGYHVWEGEVIKNRNLKINLDKLEVAMKEIQSLNEKLNAYEYKTNKEQKEDLGQVIHENLDKKIGTICNAFAQDHFADENWERFFYSNSHGHFISYGVDDRIADMRCCKQQSHPRLYGEEDLDGDYRRLSGKSQPPCSLMKDRIINRCIVDETFGFNFTNASNASF